MTIDTSHAASRATQVAEAIGISTDAHEARIVASPTHIASARARQLCVELSTEDKPIIVPVPPELDCLPVSDPRFQSYLASYLMARRYKPEAFRGLVDPGASGVLKTILKIEHRGA